jgi:hypothetical protein
MRLAAEARACGRAHLAMPEGPPAPIRTSSPNAAWAGWLASTAECRIRDPIVTAAAKQADSVIANHIECVAPALALAPRARMLAAARHPVGERDISWRQNEWSHADRSGTGAAGSRLRPARIRRDCVSSRR